MYSALKAYGSYYTGVDPEHPERLLGLEGPVPGHPERLSRKVPLTPKERTLVKELEPH
ncbi:DUF6059 family protein [Streptomyces aureus]|uniref:DUF6059 family protein n=1 Tax=Streptomyces aureus TaxID=193461 RepID=UPI00131E40F0|nr:DUF6059 family protein [Streptomyces aureus]